MMDDGLYLRLSSLVLKKHSGVQSFLHTSRIVRLIIGNFFYLCQKRSVVENALRAHDHPQFFNSLRNPPRYRVGTVFQLRIFFMIDTELKLYSSCAFSKENVDWFSQEKTGLSINCISAVLELSSGQGQYLAKSSLSSSTYSLCNCLLVYDQLQGLKRVTGKRISHPNSSECYIFQTQCLKSVGMPGRIFKVRRWSSQNCLDPQFWNCTYYRCELH